VISLDGISAMDKDEENDINKLREDVIKDDPDF